MFLSRRAIAVGSILALVLYALGFFVAATAVQCHTTPVTSSGGFTCGTQSGGGQIGATVATLILFAAFIVMMTTWVLGLVTAARIRAWIWFVLIFLLPPFSTLAYGIFGPDASRSKRLTYIEGTPPTPVA